MTSLRTVRTVAGRACALLVAGLVVGLLVALVALPRLAGATPYTILTGSMKPGMPPGTVVVVRPRPADEIKTGDVITFQLKSGDPTVATHRVVEVRTALDGSREFVTQGDANDVTDRAPVRPVQVKGVRWYDVPLVGRPGLLLDGHQKQWLFTGVITVLLAYAASNVIGSVRDRRRATAAHNHRSATVDDRALEEVGS